MTSRPALDAYIICASPRTGSTLLCTLLESTGVAGRPESYFRRESFAEYAEHWGIPGAAGGGFDAAYLAAAVAAGSTPNGVFGARVMGDSRPELIDTLAALRTGPPKSDLDLLIGAFGRTRFVHLRRADAIAQAVSWARAEQTHFWHPGEDVIPGGRSPHFDRDLIGRLAARIEELQAGWRAWFAEQRIDPCEITYEELAADPVGVARGVLDFLGLELPAGRSIATRQRRQADDLNADWIARYRGR